MSDDVMTVEEAAQRLRIGRRQAYQLVREGRIPALHLGRSIRIPVAAFEAMLDPAGSLSIQRTPTDVGPDR